MKKVLVLANNDIGLYNFRKELIKTLILENYEVHISLPNGNKIKILKEMGCNYIDTHFNRHSKNPFNEIVLILKYIKIINSVKPDVILLYTVKPNIYGGIVSQILGYPYISNITGLGSVIHKKGIFSKILIFLYKTALKKSSCVFFQNEHNKLFFSDNKIGLDTGRLLPGSGVNLIEFSLCPYPEKKQINFLFVGRLMKDKGIEELVAAARVIKQKYWNVTFNVIGSAEENYREKIIELTEMNIVNFLGFKKNVKDYIEKCDAIVHPSYHEGMANVLLEAASMGRPIIASDIPGCSETFDESVSGYGFRAKNVDDLVSVLMKFIHLKPSEKQAMGEAGRIKMEQEFDRNIVINAYMEEIGKLLKKSDDKF